MRHTHKDRQFVNVMFFNNTYIYGLCIVYVFLYGIWMWNGWTVCLCELCIVYVSVSYVHYTHLNYVQYMNLCELCAAYVSANCVQCLSLCTVYSIYISLWTVCSIWISVNCVHVSACWDVMYCTACWQSHLIGGFTWTGLLCTAPADDRRYLSSY